MRKFFCMTYSEAMPLQRKGRLCATIAEYQSKAKEAQIQRMTEAFGINEEELRKMAGLRLTEKNINEFGRFDRLKSAFDKAKALEYFGEGIPQYKVNMMFDALLRRFLLEGGIDM